jgi:hypothetical protein
MKARLGEIMRNLVAACCIVVLAACASPSTNMRVGGAQTYEGLAAQREASRAITQLDKVPPGAVNIGPIDASRCHRYQGDIEPTDQQVMDDLKAAAYARGADGIAEVDITRETALTRNCWFVITGKATMFRAGQK